MAISAGDLFLKWIFPVLGGLASVLMFLAPFRAVQRSRRDRLLGDLNPVPYPAQTANAAGWIAYAYVISPTNLQGSALIFVPNFIGLLLGLYFTMSCYGLANTKVRDRQMATIVFFSAVLSLLGAIGVMTRMPSTSLQLLWGFTSNAILLIYYAAPLSVLLSVINTRNAATLSWPLSIMQIINGSMWLGYGLAVQDPFIWVPNGIGACTGGLTTFLLIIFRKSSKRSPAPSEADTNCSRRELTSPEEDSMRNEEESGAGHDIDSPA